MIGKSEYQIKHKEFGIFQGVVENILLWYPVSVFPEIGIFRFEQREIAEKFISDYCKAMSCDKNVFEIEDYDYELNLCLCCSKMVSDE